MRFSDYFDKYLKNDESIKNKIKILRMQEDIISNYDYIDKIVNCLDDDIYNIEFYSCFYVFLRDFIIDNYYYEFYDFDYIVIKYKDKFIKLEDNDFSYVNDSKVYIDFFDIVNNRENMKKNIYLKSLNDLEEINTILPKKLIKKKLNLQI